MLRDLKIKIFADGAGVKSMLALYANPLIHGMTTNPTLMHQVGITDYEGFAREVLETVRDKPISFEVFSDEFPEMRRQALKIAAWQNNVYVKIPVTNTMGVDSCALIRELAAEGVKLNITAMLGADQLSRVVQVLDANVPAVLSIFAGRVADTGVDPQPLMRECLAITRGLPKAELLWASVREVLNIYQAEGCGCDIVTVPHDILSKAIQLSGMGLNELSLDTVKMFARDAAKAGYRL